jgi:hypothetical protein
VSVENPSVAIVLGSVTPPQGDVKNLTVHLGCTDEVSSFELLMQNWDKKYSPSGTYPIQEGASATMYVGRGANCPLLLTGKIEKVNYPGTSTTHYVRVCGRCVGKSLFSKRVTKTYTSQKGEAIVKDIINNYTVLSHTRGITELIEDTDTTYTLLEYSDTPVIDIIKYIASTADKGGVIGFDFRVAPDGKFEFFAKNSKTSSVNLTDAIEESDYSKDSLRIRNKVTIKGAPDKSNPADKDADTESLTPTDGVWSSPTGDTLTFDTSTKIKGTGSIKAACTNAYYGSMMFTFNSGKEVNGNEYPVLSFWPQRESAFNGNMNVYLIDTSNRTATYFFNFGPSKWFQKQFKAGALYADQWDVQSGFDWTQIKKVRWDCWFDATGSGAFWIDGFFFGGKRYSAVREDSGSQTKYDIQEYSDTDEELYSDNECDLRAKAVLAFLKEYAEYSVIKSTVLDYGTTPVLPADKITVELPNENVNAAFRIQTGVEYVFDAGKNELEVSFVVGREIQQLADYLYALKSKTDHVTRHKIARLI